MKKNIFKKFLSAFLVLSVLFGLLYFAVLKITDTLYPLKYKEIVERHTAEYELSQSFVFAVIKCESGFDERAVSSVGARGLMQIMPETFLWLCEKQGETYTEDDLFDPEVNIKYGTMYYGMMLKRFENLETAVAAYHAGTTNVKKWLSDERYSLDGKTLYDMPFPQTKAYVERVLKTKSIYEKILTEE